MWRAGDCPATSCWWRTLCGDTSSSCLRHSRAWHPRLCLWRPALLPLTRSVRAGGQLCWPGQQSRAVRDASTRASTAASWARLGAHWRLSRREPEGMLWQWRMGDRKGGDSRPALLRLLLLRLLLLCLRLLPPRLEALSCTRPCTPSGCGTRLTASGAPAGPVSEW